jgi:nucleoside-diphosphate-sugar epimerase
MKLVLFGANGQTGRLLTSHALAAGHRVVAVTRHPRDLPVAGPGLTVAGVDVRDEAAVGDVVVGADAVLSTLGVSFTREHVDTYSVGTANIVAGMRAAHVRRLVVVSSTAAYPTRRTGSPLTVRLMEPIITRTIGKTVYEDIRSMETIVRSSDLDWTIVRPSGLFRPRRAGRLSRRRNRSDRCVHRAHRSGPLPAGPGRRSGVGRQNGRRVDHRRHSGGVADDPARGRCKTRVILVTGATGTIGRPLVDLLSSAGQQVRALARHAATPPNRRTTWRRGRCR